MVILEIIIYSQRLNCLFHSSTHTIDLLILFVTLTYKLYIQYIVRVFLSLCVCNNMLPPIVGNVEWVVTKVSSVSSVGVGIVLLNAAVSYSENLIFDNIDPTTHISDVGEKTYMTLVDNAKLAQIAMQQFGCFFLDKKTMKDATEKLTDVFDITFGTAYVHLSTLAKYLFGEDYWRQVFEEQIADYRFCD